ncbi:MAG: HlyD family efflux transporter periplasmic adaptor subunit [Candidatus Kapabacteria bacterium]|nr:HlyD family efflux transporter periplasmic adaptor subunit [Candidatus Kapabacteria bacterium]
MTSTQLQQTMISLKMVEAPKNARPLAILIIIMILIIVSAFVFIPWQQTVAGSGDVTSFVPNARAQTIEATINGRIVAWYVNEGANIKAGDTIAVLQDINVNFIDPNFADRLETARDNILLAQDAAIVTAMERTKQAVQSLEAARASFDAVKTEVSIARTRYQRAIHLSDSGLVSRRDLESAIVNYTKATNDSIRFDAAVKSARQNFEAVKSEQERIERQANVTIQEAELRLSNARGRRSGSAIISPINGQVTRIMKAGAGQTVKEGDKLAVVVPYTGDIAAEIFVSGMDAALVDVGKHVTLQFAGFPAFQFSGLPEMGIGTFHGKVAAIDAVDDGKGKFRILVVPDTTYGSWPNRSYLRQGSDVTGWVLLNKVSLGYEVWRQLNGFPPQFPVRAHGVTDVKEEQSKEKK